MIDLDPFYPIVDSAAWVERLVGAGARLIQLRAKERPAEDIRAQTRAALAVCARRGAQLVVNDYWEIAIDEGADFIHLGQTDLDGADMNRIRGRGLRVGNQHPRSRRTRSRSVIRSGLCRAGADLSDDPQGDGLRAAGGGANWRMEGALSAGGRWSPSAASRWSGRRCASTAGADSAAVVTDITLNADPEGRAKAWLAATRRKA